MTKFINSEFFRFVILGGTNTLLTYIAYLLLLPLMSYTLANALTYVVSIGAAYYVNSRFVFHQPLEWKKAFQYPLIYVVQLLASTVLLVILVERLHISEVIAPIVVVIALVPLTFVLSRTIIKGRRA